MLRLACKLFPRLLRRGSFSLLLISASIACACISAIALFVDRIDRTFNDEAASFIGADALIKGTQSMPQGWRQLAHQKHLSTAEFLELRAMLIAGDSMSLASVKAVDNNYPLKGELRVTRGDNIEQVHQRGPERGKVWLTPRLLPLLDLNIGDSLQIGEASFIVDGEIRHEPDSAQSAFGVAPRAMIHRDDLEATGAVQFGSRVEHHMMLAGSENDVSAFRTQIEAEMGEHFRWISPRQSNARLNSVMDRANRFLLLAGSLNVVLSAIAIALSARQFADSQSNQVALLKTLGLNFRQISRLYLALFSALALVAFCLGSLVGWGLHHLLLVMLKSVLPQTLASAGSLPFLYGATTVLIALFAFAAPPLVALKSIEPSAILRRSEQLTSSNWLHYVLALAATFVLLWVYSQDVNLSAIILTGLLTCGLIGVILARWSLQAVQSISKNWNTMLRIALTNLRRQTALTALQIFVFSSIAMLIVILVQTRTNIVEDWRPQYQNAPNHFVFNIFDDELDPVKDLLTMNKVVASAFYPMTRGRLTEINDTPIVDRIIEGGDRRYERELNLTWSDTLGADNTVVNGDWWSEQSPKDSPLLVSAEEEFAEGLGLVVGEKIRFSIAGREIEATLDNIRSVQWDSMNPNFFMIFNRPIAETWAANWITSFHLTKQQKPFVNTLVREFPTLTLIELDQTLALINSVASRASMAIEFILILVLAAAILVMITSIQASLEERRRESALLRSFGASRNFVQRILLFEFGCIGLLSGLLACIGAELGLYYLMNTVLRLEYHFQWQIWLFTPVISTVLIAAVGYFATLGITHVAPLHILRQRD